MILLGQKRMEAVEVEKKPLPVGRKDIEDVIERGCYYVDKTLFIKEIIDSAAEVTLFTRPRRFGKTMNMYMLNRFFECDMDSKGEIIDHSKCFNGLKIMSAGEKYKEHREWPLGCLGGMFQGLCQLVFMFQGLEEE